MLDLFVGTDAVQRQIRQSLEPKRPATRTCKPIRRQRAVVRSTSAAALRGLANLLEPSPT